MTCVDDWMLPGKSLDYPFFYKGEAGESSVFCSCVFAMIRDEAKGVKRSGDVIHVACFSIVSFGVFGLGVE
jgi:hypothetical protein